MMRTIIFSFFITIFCSSCVSQNNNKIKDFYSLYTRDGKVDLSEKINAVNKSRSGDSYQFMELRRPLGALNTIISVTSDSALIQEQITLINNVLDTAKKSKNIPNNKSEFKDDYKGWVAVNTNTKNESSKYQEIPLFESYSFLYIAQFLYLLKENDWVEKSDENMKWWKSTLAFIEQNIWQKWYDRSLHKYGNNYGYFIRERTHMGAHWAGIAMYLNRLTENSKIINQTNTLVSQYDILLKRNLKIKNNAYIWNSTYDDISGTYAPRRSGSVMQDVSHGNHVVTYIIAAYELGNDNWTKNDIQYLANTVKWLIYNKSRNRFYTNVDGTGSLSWTGLGDGWLKLRVYDKDVAEIFKRYSKEHSSQKNLLHIQYQTNLRFYFSNK